MPREFTIAKLSISKLGSTNNTDALINDVKIQYSYLSTRCKSSCIDEAYMIYMF